MLGLARDGVGRLLWPVIRHSLQRTVNVVYYHHVGPSQPHYASFYRGCTVSKFADQLRELNRVFDFVPLDEMLSPGSAPPERNHRPVLAVTFDDGFDLRKGGVMEVLDQFKVKATTFVVTAMVGNQMLMWRYMLSTILAMVPDQVWRCQYAELAAAHSLGQLPRDQTLMDASCRWNMNLKDELVAELWERCHLIPVKAYLEDKRPYFDWVGLKEWLAAGHSIGFHTHTHPFCSRLERTDLEREFILPVVELKRRLGLADVCLSYPFGDRLQPALEHELCEKRLFKAFFGTEGFTERGRSSEKLGRLSLEGHSVPERLRAERFRAFRRGWLGRHDLSL